MLNVIIWLYNNGFSYAYSYEGRYNVIRCIDDRVTEKQIDELKDLCENDKIEFSNIGSVIIMQFTPYEGKEI